MSNIDGYGEFPFEIGDIIIDQHGDLMRIDDLHWHHISITCLSGSLKGQNGITMRTERAHECRKVVEEVVGKSDSPRDTQFQELAYKVERKMHFAAFVAYHSGKKKVEVDKVCRKILAQALYDLACHVVTYLNEDVAWRKGKGYTASQIVENDVPDMTELPKEQE